MGCFLLKSNGVDRMIGTEFPDGKNVVVTKADGSKVEMKADNVVLVTLIEILVLLFRGPHLGFDQSPCSNDCSRRLVIGGGYIGLEMGMMFAKLGTGVTVVEMGASV